MIKKLIEVALPLEKINEESAREKSIRHGHPSTLHLWWARRPLAAARAVIWASLVDDPSSHPEEFPTEEEQNQERQRLFRILEELVVWENSNNERVLEAAKAEIMKSTGGNPPELLDPFAGGGAIPLEAQRLGLVAHAHDLNPVAVMINKAMIEIPPKFARRPPVNPEYREVFELLDWPGVKGLAEDVRYYGEWMKQKAWERIGHLYPKVKDENGKEHTVIAWIWARTVKCPNPACGCEVPLVKSFYISQRKGKEVWVEPHIENGEISFEIKYGLGKPHDATVDQKIKGAKCISCDASISFNALRDMASSGKMKLSLMAVAIDNQKKREYISVDKLTENSINQIERCTYGPTLELPDKALGFRIQQYGLKNFSELFSPRQYNMLTCFAGLIDEVREEILSDAIKHGSEESYADEYAKAVSVYLAFAVDRMANYGSMQCLWDTRGGTIVQTFGRQALSFIWNFAEANPFSNVNLAGNWLNSVDVVANSLSELPHMSNKKGNVKQHNAMELKTFSEIMISTDPPYYDNIGYADLSDFFYLWLRYSLKGSFPDLFQTMAVPKSEELIANPFRFEQKDDARIFFESGMKNVFEKIHAYSHKDIPVTVYYAFKQNEISDESVISTGWETMLSAIIKAGFLITGTWPIRTENPGGLRVNNRNALASSIVLVCRKREETARTCSRRDFANALKKELKTALEALQASNIAPVDLAQAAIGPGMAIFSRYKQVLEADGSPMSVRGALQLINQELDSYFNDQGNMLDRSSRFCLDLFMQNAYNEIKFGEADVLARAKNTSVQHLEQAGVLSAQKGSVRLLERDELPEPSPDSEKIVWLLCQQLTRAMETGGNSACAAIAAGVSAVSSALEDAKNLAYRLYSFCERKGWAKEAGPYNALVTAWQEIMQKADELRCSDIAGTIKWDV